MISTIAKAMRIHPLEDPEVSLAYIKLASKEISPEKAYEVNRALNFLFFEARNCARVHFEAPVVSEEMVCKAINSAIGRVVYSTEYSAPFYR